MKLEQLRAILSQIGLTIPDPNHSGWAHLICPFGPWKHYGGRDNSPSFALKVEDDGISAYKCMGCGSHGRVSNLVRELGQLRGEDYTELARTADDAERMSVTAVDFEQRQLSVAGQVRKQITPIDEAMYDGIFDDPFAHPAPAEYLRTRNVSPETAAWIGIGFDPEKKRLTFPVRDGKGALYGFTGRTILPNHKPKVLDYAGLPKRHLILGEDKWVRGRPILLVEGLFAYAHMIELGMHNDVNVGALLGSSVTEEKADRLNSYPEAKVMMLDPDKAGDAGLYGEIIPGEEDEQGRPRRKPGGALDLMVDHSPVYVTNYPEGVDDPDDLTRDQAMHMIRTAWKAVRPPELKKKAVDKR